MKTIQVDGNSVECSSDDKNYICCYIKEHDIYFSAKNGDNEMVIKKTRALINAKDNFLIEFPQYKN
jgi:hypothetical protein